MAEECLEGFQRFFQRDLKQHRMEFISMLNYLIENFPFGLICLLKLEETSISPSLRRRPSIRSFVSS